MPTLFLVRHGRAAAGWDKDLDPGLDELGHAQAQRAVQTLVARGKFGLLASPMKRTRETAAPFARAWGIEPRIEPRVSEIPSPTADLQARGQWLRAISGKTWGELDPTLRQWREQVVAALAEIEQDSVIVTHYIAINAAAGAAVGDDRVVNFRPDYCSITTLESTAGRLRLISRGDEGETKIL